jgi:hypothetical protein
LEAVSSLNSSIFALSGLFILAGGVVAYPPVSVYKAREKRLATIKANRRDYQLEMVDSIRLGESVDLTALLDIPHGLDNNGLRIRPDRAPYSGRLFRAMALDGALLSDSTAPRYAMEIEVSRSRMGWTDFDLEKAYEHGYRAFHRYAPRRNSPYSAVHLSITASERICMPSNTIALLTVPLARGPVLLGYNTVDTFLLKDPDSRVLEKVTPDDVYVFLGEK